MPAYRTPEGLVIDGDTVIRPDGTRVRLTGADAPEYAHPDSGLRQEPLAEEATAYLAEQLGRPGGQVRGGGGTDVYGRSLGRASNSTSPNIAADMVRRGLATPMASEPEIVGAQRQRENEALGFAPYTAPELESRRRQQMSGAQLNYTVGSAKKRTVKERASDAVARGVDQIQQLGGGLAKLGGDLTGIDALSDSGDRVIKHNQAQLEMNAPDVGSYKDVDSVSSAASYVLERTLEQAPTLAGALVSGGVGALGARAGFSRLTAEALASEAALADAAVLSQSELIKRGAQAGALAFNLGVNLGDEKIHLDAADPNRSKEIGHNLTVLGTGAVMAGVETLSDVKQFESLIAPIAQSHRVSARWLATATKRAAQTGAKNIALEGGEEGLQAIAQEVAKNARTGQAVDWESVKEQAVAGAAAGGAVGAVAGAGRGTLEHMGQNTTREPAAVIDAQVADMQDPNTPRDSVYMSAENRAEAEALATNPDASDLHLVEDESGGVLATTNGEIAAEYETNPTDDTRAAALQYTEPKSENVDPATSVAVVTRNTKGVPLKEEIISPSNVDRAVAAQQAVAAEGHTVEVSTPEDSQRERAEAVAAEDAARSTVFATVDDAIWALEEVRKRDPNSDLAVQRTARGIELLPLLDSPESGPTSEQVVDEPQPEERSEYEFSESEPNPLQMRDTFTVPLRTKHHDNARQHQEIAASFDPSTEYRYSKEGDEHVVTPVKREFPTRAAADRYAEAAQQTHPEISLTPREQNGKFVLDAAVAPDAVQASPSVNVRDRDAPLERMTRTQRVRYGLMKATRQGRTLSRLSVTKAKTARSKSNAAVAGLMGLRATDPNGKAVTLRMVDLTTMGMELNNNDRGKRSRDQEILEGFLTGLAAAEEAGYAIDKTESIGSVNDSSLAGRAVRNKVVYSESGDYQKDGVTLGSLIASQHERLSPVLEINELERAIPKLVDTIRGGDAGAVEAAKEDLSAKRARLAGLKAELRIDPNQNRSVADGRNDPIVDDTEVGEGGEGAKFAADARVREDQTVRTVDENTGEYLNYSKFELRHVESGATPRGVSKDAAENAVQDFLNRFPGARPADVLVYDRESSAFGAANQGNSIIKGGFDPENDRLIIIAANHHSIGDILATVRHELFVHKGLGLFTAGELDEVSSILNQALIDAKDNDRVSQLWAKTQRDYADKPFRTQLEELLARVAEGGHGKVSAAWNRFVFKLRQWLIAKGFLDKSTSLYELREMVRALGERLAAGETPTARDVPMRERRVIEQATKKFNELYNGKASVTIRESLNALSAPLRSTHEQIGLISKELQRMVWTPPDGTTNAARPDYMNGVSSARRYLYRDYNRLVDSVGKFSIQDKVSGKADRARVAALNAAVAEIQNGVPKSQRSALANEMADYLDTVGKYASQFVKGFRMLPNFFPQFWDKDSIVGDQNGFVNFLVEGQFEFTDVDGNKRKVDMDTAQQIVSNITAEHDHVDSNLPWAGSVNSRVLTDPSLQAAAREAGFLYKDPQQVLQYYTDSMVKYVEYEKQFGDWVTFVDLDNAGLQKRLTSLGLWSAEVEKKKGRSAALKLALSRGQERGIVVEHEAQTGRDSVETSYDIWSGSAKYDQIKRDILGDKPRAEDIAAAKRLDKLMAGLLGNLGGDMDPRWKHAQQWVGAIELITTLAMSTISSIPELGVALAKAPSLSAAWTGLRETLGHFKGSYALLEQLGFTAERMVTIGALDSSQYQDLRGVPRVMIESFFRINGQHYFTNFNRTLNLQIGVAALRDAIDTRHTGEAAEQTQAFLRQLGITAVDVDRWLAAGMPMDNSEGGQSLAISGYTHPVAVALHRFVDGRVVMPNTAMKPLMANDPRFQLLWQLKSFFYGSWEVITKPLMREVMRRYEAAEGPAAKRMVQASIPLLVMAAMTMPLAFAARELKDELRDQDRNQLEWSQVDDLIRQTGVLGPVEMALSFKTAEDQNRSGFATLLGPAAGHLETLVEHGPFSKEFLRRSTPIAGQIPQLWE